MHLRVAYCILFAFDIVLYSLQAGEQGRLPVLILSMKESTQQRRPAIVLLHSSYKCKEWLRPLLEVDWP